MLNFGAPPEVRLAKVELASLRANAFGLLFNFHSSLSKACSKRVSMPLDLEKETDREREKASLVTIIKLRKC